ncbi:MAG: uncharacterized protein KVP18_001296, partial [Porospora cf. gigantea A]|uniref:uncharacterized protein n=2 Tax=Porospora cf. gigantea A TaxID=2853593 RepID=UPI00355A6C79
KHWIDHIRAENARLEALRNGWQVEQQEGQQEGQQEEKQEEKQTDGEVVDPSGGFDGTRTMADGRRVTRVKKGDLPPPSEGRRYIQLTPADPKYPSVEVEVLPGETDESAMDRAGKEFNRKCQEMAAMVTALEVSEYDVTDKGCIETTETTVDRLWTDSNLPSCGLPKVPANTPNESNSADCLENPRCVIGSEAVHCMPMASEGLQESLVMSPSVFPPAGMGSEGTNQTIMAPPSAYIKRPGRQKKKGYWCGL